MGAARLPTCRYKVYTCTFRSVAADSVGPNAAGVPAGGVANDGVDGETAPLLPAAAGRGATADAQGVTLLFEQVQQEVQLLRSELKAHKSGGGLCPATCTVL